jgi:alcohol dehydrogenase class IV
VHTFTYDQLPSRVIFGTGSLARLRDEIERLGARHALILSTPGRRSDAERASADLGSLSAGVFAEAVMHVPIETAQAARDIAERLAADLCVAIGGGSTVGLAKAIALDRALPIVAVPTTFSGSEMTAIYGLTESGVKRTGRSARVLPKTVLYDPLLTLTLPARIAGPSGMNAIAHAVEALYAPDANPVTSLMAVESIRVLSRSLPHVVDEQEDLESRADAQYGAWLAGISLGATSMGVHHKLCHALGGSFNLPHADVHTVILPHAVRFNRDAAKDVMRTIASALGTIDAAEGLFDLAVRLHAPLSLQQIGMPVGGLDRAAAIATANPYANPRPVEFAGIRELLERAYYGIRPDR